MLAAGRPSCSRPYGANLMDGIASDPTYYLGTRLAIGARFALTHEV
jgi:hypothetical protein